MLAGRDVALGREIELRDPLNLTYLDPPVVVAPIQSWTNIAQKALRFAVHLSTEVHRGT